MDSSKIITGAVAATAVAASLLGYFFIKSENNIPKKKIEKENKENKEYKEDVIEKKDETLRFEDVFVSKPYNLSKDFSISYENGEYKGVPEEVLVALRKSGLNLEQVSKNPKLALEVLYSLDYNKIRKSSISDPFSFQHNVHIRWNEKTSQFEGLPDAVQDALKKSGLSHEELSKNPEKVQTLLYSLEEKSVYSKPSISKPVSTTHDFSITIDPKTGDITGVPSPILDAIKSAGYTLQQIRENPALIKNLLYHFDYDSLKPDAPKISKPTDVSHDFSISFDPSTNTLKGVPPEILTAIHTAGYKTEDILKDPTIVKNLLYNFQYDHVKPTAMKISEPKKVSHDFHIQVDKDGNVMGLPQEIQDAIKNAGYSQNQILQNPEILRSLLYNFDYNSLKPDAPKISPPSDCTNDFRITVNKETGEVSGVPQPILDAIKNAGYTPTTISSNLELLKQLLYNFDYDSLKPGAPEISSPQKITHDFQISHDRETGTFSGIPPQILEATEKKGLTIEEVIKNPSLISDLLYSLKYEDLKPEKSLPIPVETFEVSAPTNVTHVVSISRKEDGSFEGVPEVIKSEILKNFSEQEVLENPEKVKDLLYNFDINTVTNQVKVM